MRIIFFTVCDFKDRISLLTLKRDSELMDSLSNNLIFDMIYLLGHLHSRSQQRTDQRVLVLTLNFEIPQQPIKMD